MKYRLTARYVVYSITQYSTHVHMIELGGDSLLHLAKSLRCTERHQDLLKHDSSHRDQKARRHCDFLRLNRKPRPPSSSGINLQTDKLDPETNAVITESRSNTWVPRQKWTFDSLLLHKSKRFFCLFPSLSFWFISLFCACFLCSHPRSLTLRWCDEAGRNSKDWLLWYETTWDHIAKPGVKVHLISLQWNRFLNLSNMNVNHEPSFWSSWPHHRSGMKAPVVTPEVSSH